MRSFYVIATSVVEDGKLVEYYVRSVDAIFALGELQGVRYDLTQELSEAEIGSVNVMAAIRDQINAMKLSTRFALKELRFGFYH